MKKHTFVFGFFVLSFLGNLSAQTPTLDWTRMIDVDNLEYPYDMVTDAAGNLYIAGRTGGTASTSTAIVKKVKSDGSSVEWTAMVCVGQALGIGLDANGDVYVSGHARSGLSVSTGAFQTSVSGASDAFVAKLNGATGALLDATYFGGSGDENEPAYPNFSGRNHSSEPLKLGLDVDASGNVFITGFTESPNLPGALNSFNPNVSAYLEWSGFIAKFSSDLTTATSVYAGGGYNDVISDIEVVGTDVYVCGSSYSHSNDYNFVMTGFDTQHDDYTYKYAGIVMKFDNNLGFMNGTYLGGATNTFDTDPEHVFARSLASDGTDIYVVGDIGGNHPEDFFTAGSYQKGRSTKRNIFYSKLSNDLSTNMYSGYIGGIESSYGTTLFVAGGQIFLGGSTDEAGISDPALDYPTTIDATQTSISGGSDFVMTQLSTDGTNVTYSTFFGSPTDDYVLSMDRGSVKGVGATHGVPGDFPNGVAGADTNPSGDDAWIAFSTSGIELPVELSSFTAVPKDKSVVLNWSTASELNNEGFDVEHSTDGTNFKTAGFVRGNGTTAQANDYDFIHRTPADGTNYYRLKQMDFDGGIEYSEIKKVEIEVRGFSTSLFPNPARGFFNVNIVADAGRDYTVNIYNAIGQRVKEIALDGTDGSLIENINTADFAKGLYFVEITDGTATQTRKLIIE